MADDLVGRIHYKLLKRVRGLRSRLYWVRQNRLGKARLARELGPARPPLDDLTRYERRLCSQHGEDGILEAVFARIQTTNRYFVEFGVGSGRENNTAYLLKRQGWTGLWMDCQPPRKKRLLEIHTEQVTAENINALFSKYGVPPVFDLLSIDIDGNDYWVWKALTGYRPRVAVIEYNASIPPDEARTIPYDPHFVWDKSDYFGASLLALANLGKAKGYVLVACDSAGANAFFVDEALCAGHFAPHPVTVLYRPPAYRGGHGHRHDPLRRMMRVEEDERQRLPAR
jgi:hypothetical protein